MKGRDKLVRTQILVTGGTGYIGSHTVVELLKVAMMLEVVDDFSTVRFRS